MKILVLRLSSMGDVILSTAVMESLRGAGCEVSFVTKPTFAPLVEGIPGISQIYHFDKSIAGGEAAARKKFLEWAEAQNFSGILDLQDSWRTWFWRFRLKGLCPVIVCSKERWREILVIFFRLGPWLGFGRGGRARNFKQAAEKLLLRLNLGPQPKNTVLTEFFVSREDKARSLARVGASPYIVLVPGSAWEGKRWPKEYFSAIGQELSCRYKILILAGSKDLFAQEIGAQVAGSQVFLDLPLKEVGGVLSGSALVIGNDTGLTHMAEALGVPCLVIEGPTSPALGFSPQAATTKLMGLPLLCRPCSKSGQLCLRGGTRLCLNGLTPDMVLTVANEQLQGRPA